MEEKNKWAIQRLDEKTAENKRRREDHEVRIRELESFKTETIERLKTVFNRLKDIEQSNQWVSKTFFTLIFGGVVTAVGTFLNWALSR